MSNPSATLVARSAATRWLGVGLATSVCIVTITLFLTGRLALYINPDGSWFAVAMAVLGVVIAVASFALPAGSEADHGHDHGHGGHLHAGSDAGFFPDEEATDRPAAQPPVLARTDNDATCDDASGVTLTRREQRELRERREAEAAAAAALTSASDADRASSHDHTGGAGEHGHTLPPAPGADSEKPAPLRRYLGTLATVTAGIVSSAVIVLMLALPPASLSADAAAQRDIGVAPLFGGDDTVVLAASGNTDEFGVGEWATVFATTGNPASFDGRQVTLTGFVTERDGAPQLSRLVVTHCVIDAQPASIQVSGVDGQSAGQWLQIEGTIAATASGALEVIPTTVTEIDEPSDPYEY